MNIAFTGTQEGMTPHQMNAFWGYIQWHFDYGAEFHHGVCVGADIEAAEICHKYFGYRIIGHPPEDTSKMTEDPFSDYTWPSKPYLTRDREIVHCGSYLIACPKGFTEERRSGTWYTIRYAREQKKDVTIIYPDGTEVEEYNEDR